MHFHFVTEKAFQWASFEGAERRLKWNSWREQLAERERESHWLMRLRARVEEEEEEEEREKHKGRMVEENASVKCECMIY